MRLLVSTMLLPSVLLLSIDTTLAQVDRYSQSPLGPPPSTTPTGGEAAGGSAPAATTGTGARELLQGFDISQGNLPGDNRSAAPVGNQPSAQPLNSGGAAALPRSPASPPPNSYTRESPYTPAAPATAETLPPPSTREPADTQYAKDLMKAALSEPSTSRLTGSRVYLTDVVARANSRSEQSECIGAYWDLCSAVSDYYLSLREQSDLGNLVARSGQTPTLQQALKKLETRRDTALTAARASQRRLASLMGRNQTSPLPLPGDMPHCGAYHTRYTQYFPNSDSPEAAELNQLLPLRHAELLDAAAAVSQAENFFNQIAGRQVNDQGVELLMQLEGLALKRRAFVQIARDYNKRVSRYTELARPGDLGANRLVSMLIKSGGNVASRTSQPTTPGFRNRSQSDPPHTFQQDANPLRDTAPRLDEEVMTTSGEQPNGEAHSIVEKIAPGETSVLRRKAAE